MELKFDRARFDMGEMPTRTRDGQQVLHVHDSGLEVIRPIVAWLDEGESFSYLKDGRIYHDRECHLDLVHEPQKVRVGLRRSESCFSGFVSTTEQEVINLWRTRGHLVAEVEVAIGEGV